MKLGAFGWRWLDASLDRRVCCEEEEEALLQLKETVHFVFNLEKYIVFKVFPQVGKCLCA